MQFGQSTRREFITRLGGTAHAQHGERMRRIGVLSSLSADDPEWHGRVAVAIVDFCNNIGTDLKARPL
jgi:hypothetical protein